MILLIFLFKYIIWIYFILSFLLWGNLHSFLILVVTHLYFSPQFFQPTDFVEFGCLCLLCHHFPSNGSYSFIMSFSDFRFREAGSFLLAFILPVSVFIIITTVNNNIYNYGYKHRHKKKHKLLNWISNHILHKKKNHHYWPTFKVKEKKHFQPNTSVDLLRDILLLLFSHKPSDDPRPSNKPSDTAQNAKTNQGQHANLINCINIYELKTIKLCAEILNF